MRWTHPRTAVLVGTFSLVIALATGCSSDADDGSGSSGETTTTAAEPSPRAAALQERVAAVAEPEVEGPITGGGYDVPYLGMPEGWEDEFGYTEEEFFVSGDATTYAADGELGTDGEWTVTEGEALPYATRMVVRRPADPADFSGTLVVEWLNTSAGRDSDPDFGFLASELFAEGHAYVAVSAQKIGVEPGGLGIEIPNVSPEALAPLKEWDPERYGELSHPGDAASYDIYSQATKAALDPAEGAPLGGLDVEQVVAVGESQSAYRLTTYANAIQPTTDLFDGFLIHSRGGGGAPISGADDEEMASIVHVRADLGVPVLQFATETDLYGLGFAAARQDDTDQLVTWEAAGTAHADRSTLDYAVSAGRRWTDEEVDLSSSCGTINDGPQEPIVQAGFHHLVAWIGGGDPPPASPRIETADDAIVRDEAGIAEGGIRTPPVDAPTSILSGDNDTDLVICSLFGSEVPLTSEQLAERYADHDAYVAAVTASAQQAEADGYLLERHTEQFIDEADEADVP